MAVTGGAVAISDANGAAAIAAAGAASLAAASPAISAVPSAAAGTAVSAAAAAASASTGAAASAAIDVLLGPEPAEGAPLGAGASKRLATSSHHVKAAEARRS